MNAEQIVTKFEQFEKKYGQDAPYMLVRWCGLAEQSEDAQCQVIAEAIRKSIVKLEMRRFNQRAKISLLAKYGVTITEEEMLHDFVEEVKSTVYLATIVERSYNAEHGDDPM